MSIDSLAAVIFILSISYFLWANRSKVEFQKALFPILYVIMYRSTFGLKGMKRLADRFPRLLRLLGGTGTVIGFIGMAVIAIELIRTTILLFISTDPLPGIQPVLPIEAKGVFFIPFIYWIISIFSIALVHEFAHGILANVHKIPVKSSGFAFLSILVPIIPAAFVEPDETLLRKKPNRQQLAVFAAGPFSNILFAALVFGLFFAISPVLDAAYEPKGVELLSASNASYNAGLREGDIVVSMNEIKTIS